MLFLGIDPGITGGVAIIDQRGEIVLAELMPAQPAPLAGKRWIDTAALARLIRPHAPDLAAVELVHAMPQQGVSSTFTFGRVCGAIDGVLGTLGIGIEYVKPQAWKKHHALPADKSAAIGAAARRWPSLSLKKSEDGIAEALLIAEWLRCRQPTRKESHVSTD